ncbi:MAG: ABC transporter permease, partial [Muribaculaceae bacterium]|nr:ABC transporter permease [Muribaculaceae bacterium]
FDLENWKEIGATLSRNKTRTFLTGFGIFWGVAMLALLLGGARGGKDLLMRNFEGFATNCAFGFSGRTSMPYKGFAKGRAWDIELTDLEAVRQAFPELKAVTGNQWSNGSFRNDKYVTSGQTMGSFPELLDVMLPKIYYGRFVNATDIAKGRKVACVGKRVAEQLYPGAPSPLGKSILVNNISYTIIGIIGQESNLQVGGRYDEMVIMPYTTFCKAYGFAESVDAIFMVANDGVNMANVLPRVRRFIYSRHAIHPNDIDAMWLKDISEEFGKLDKLFLGLSLLAGFIGFSTLIAGIIGIGNIMWIIVKERTQEIGVRRALGAKPRDIIVQILSEGMALTAVAGTAGISLAVAILAIMQKATETETSTAHFQMAPSQAFWIMAVFLILGSCAGLVPAIKAMHIKPIEALNDK